MKLALTVLLALSLHAQITSFTATPSVISPGQSVTLNWYVESFCGPDIQKINGQSVSGSSVAMAPTVTTNYTLLAYGCGSPFPTATITVTVQAPPPPPPPATTAIPLDGAWGLTSRNTDGSVILTGANPLLTNPIDLVFPSPPSPPNGYADYVFRNGNYTFTQTGSLTYVLRLQATPGTVFNGKSESQNTCTFPPATVRPMISRYPMPDAYSILDGRWWSKAIAFQIADINQNATPGTITLTVPLDNAHWSGVLGQQAVNDPDFAYTVANARSVAVTLGAGCFYGHGLQTVSGSAVLDILSITYNP